MSNIQVKQASASHLSFDEPALDKHPWFINPFLLVYCPPVHIVAGQDVKSRIGHQILHMLQGEEIRPGYYKYNSGYFKCNLVGNSKQHT